MYQLVVNSPSLDANGAWIVLASIALLVILTYLFLKYGTQRFMYVRSQDAETWLPVVDDTGNIIGRVAQGISREEPGKYQHPIVRISVWYDGKVYLTPRPSKAIFDQGMMDHPMEHLLRYGETVDEALAHLCTHLCPECSKPVFMLKYKHENKEGKWLILLYRITLTDAAGLRAPESDLGKFWSLSQINQNSGMAFFSHLLEGEISLFNTLFSPFKESALVK